MDLLLTLSVSSSAGGGMSLSPAIGTEVPETANGVVTPVASENGPHVPVSVKCGESRISCPGESSEDGSLRYMENHVDGDNRVYNNEGHLDTMIDINERTSALSLHTSRETNSSLPDTYAADSESGSLSRDIPEASNTVEPPGAALLGDSAHTKDSSHQGGPAPTDKEPTGTDTADGSTDSREEVDDGEKEKQDEEEDEKNENKWKSQYAGGRTEYDVSALQDYFSDICAILDYKYRSITVIQSAI